MSKEEELAAIRRAFEKALPERAPRPPAFALTPAQRRRYERLMAQAQERAARGEG